MKKMLIGAALLTSVSLLPAVAAAASDILEAGILHGGALAAGPAGGELAILAQGGAGRGRPAISPDGTRIAFVQNTDRRVALADVVTVSLEGKELTRTPIEPVQQGLAYAGMRYVEALRWVSPSRLAVRGSINPAQSQYYIIDTSSGRIVNDFTDDDSAAAISPDGLHVAAVAEDPHYGADASTAPTITLDDHVIARLASGTSVASALRFAPEGNAIAWATRDSRRNAALNIWTAEGVRALALSALPDAALDLHWNGARVFVRAASAGGSQIWAAGAGAKAAEHVQQDPQAPALALREKLAGQARAAGVVEPDFWCAACSLALLPRGRE
jgi:hypothetical protein